MALPHPTEISGWLDAEMARHGLTIVDLAAKSGVSRNQIGRIRSGSGTRTTTLEKLMDAFEQLAKAA